MRTSALLLSPAVEEQSGIIVRKHARVHHQTARLTKRGDSTASGRQSLTLNTMGAYRGGGSGGCGVWPADLGLGKSSRAR